MASTTAFPAIINLARGQPATQHLPRDLMQEATSRAFAVADTEQLLQYGDEQGNRRFRAALCDFINAMLARQQELRGVSAESRCAPVTPEQIFASWGASHGVSLACCMYSKPGDLVFVEDPCYHLALGMLQKDHRLRVVGVPIDEQGMRVDELERLIEQHLSTPEAQQHAHDDRAPTLKRHQYRAFLYTIPTYHNPTGVTLSDSRRRVLVDLAVRHNIAVLADEVYQLLPFDGESPPLPLPYYDQGGRHVISINSFAKILAPGLRLGWIHSGPEVVNEFTHCGLIESGGNSGFMQEVLTETLLGTPLSSSLLAARIASLQETYKHRCGVLCNSLNKHLGDVAGVSFVVPEGGYFVWVRLPDSLDTSALLQQSKETFGVAFSPGKIFSSQGLHGNRVRLCFAHYDDQHIEEGVARLGRAIRHALQGGAAGGAGV